MLGTGNQCWDFSHQEGSWLSDLVFYLDHLTAPHSLFSLPRLVFPHRRKSKADDDIIFKQYVMETGVFHFGPLLCGKSRDWYVLPP